MNTPLAVAGITTFALVAGCGGGASVHHRGAAANQNAHSTSLAKRFVVTIADATPTNPPSTYSVTQYMTAYFTGARPTKAEALKLAYQVARRSSGAVRRVRCSPTKAGWNCTYMR